MKHKSGIVKYSLVLVFLMGLALLSALWPENAVERKSDSGMGIFLTAPAFAQEAEMSFLEREAGISAYTRLDQAVSLAKARTAFRTVEKETDTYIVGSVPVPGYESEVVEDVHCFTHKDGWVAVYYLMDEPTSKIMYWKNWDGRTISTKLEEVLTSASSALGASPTDVKYYHFKYPSANRLMVIADKDSFRITIPGELVIHERSYSWKSGWTHMYIDDMSVGKDLIGLIPLAQLKPDVPHVVRNSGAIVLVYQEP